MSGHSISAIYGNLALVLTRGGWLDKAAAKLLPNSPMGKAVSYALKWTHPVQNWNLTLSQLSIHFPDRVDQYVDL